MGNLLNRSQLLEKEELEIEKIVFDDGNFICVRQMTGHERDLFEQSLIRKIKDAKGNITYEQATDDFRAKLAVVTVCNEKGESILLPGDFSLLSKNMSAKRLEKIINTAQKLNAITEEDKENILKNSEVGQADNSNSDSV
jgi:hypothetical protein